MYKRSSDEYTSSSASNSKEKDIKMLPIIDQKYVDAVNNVGINYKGQFTINTNP